MQNLPESPSTSTRRLAEVGVIVVAAGQGVRLGAGVPKAFVDLGGMTLLEHCIRTALRLDRLAHLVLVVPGDCAAEALELADECTPPGTFCDVSVVAGGRERHESVRFGLDALTDAVSTVLIHDAARPLASTDLFESVIAAVHRTRAGVIPAVPVTDTIKRIDENGMVNETVDRRALVAVQTPQGFVREDIASAHATAQLQEQSGTSTSLLPTDDAEVLERAGGSVHVIAGEERARKVTTPHDLHALEPFLPTGGVT